MRRRTSRIASLFLLALVSSAVGGGSPLLSQESLKEQLGDLEVGGSWIYDDFEAAKAKAAREQKPIFALFR